MLRRRPRGRNVCARNSDKEYAVVGRTPRHCTYITLDIRFCAPISASRHLRENVTSATFATNCEVLHSRCMVANRRRGERGHRTGASAFGSSNAPQTVQGSCRCRNDFAAWRGIGGFADQRARSFSMALSAPVVARTGGRDSLALRSFAAPTPPGVALGSQGRECAGLPGVEAIVRNLLCEVFRWPNARTAETTTTVPSR